MPNETWLRRMIKLNKARGNAPHKPLLLLVILELAENAEFSGVTLPLTPDLAFRFNTFFDVVRYRRAAKPDVRLPFHHLSTQGFWYPFMKNGDVSTNNTTTDYVVFDTDFLAACKNSQFRVDARHLLIASHFEPAERNALYHLVGIETPDSDFASQAAFFVEAEDAENIGRSARFRIDVVSAYNYTCALTGYRVTTLLSGSIVEAAHIHQFAESRNDDPRNGIALSKNAHWQFDSGLWSIDDDYRVIVAKGAFSEASPLQTPLTDLHGRKLLLPANEALWPSITHLIWHRQNRFARPDTP